MAIFETPATKYTALTQQDKTRVLLAVMREATLAARSAYADPSHPDTKRLARINELQHRLIGIACAVLNGDGRWTDRETAEYLEIGLAEMGSSKPLTSFFGL